MICSGIFHHTRVRVKIHINFPPSDPSPELRSEIHSGNILKVLKAVWQIVQEKICICEVS